MASHLIDSQIYANSWSTAEMRQIWDDRTMIGRWLKVEVALASVQAEMGIIPAEAAAEIARVAHVDLLDFDFLTAEFARTGHSLMGMLRNVQRLCAHGLGEYVHFGATTQDITDTGMMLGIAEVYDIVTRDLESIEAALMDLAERYAATPMAGRTHGQQALPITFGYKVAIWLREVGRHMQRLQESRSRVLVGNLSGGVGTYAALGERGLEVEQRVMDKIGLGHSDSGWHTSRDRLAEFVCILAMIGTTFGKIGNEIYVLQKTEIGELAEPFQMGQVGSSTMPHKRNPETAEALNGLSKLVRYRAAMMLEALVGEHERDGSAWKTEWVTIPEACLFLSAILNKVLPMLQGLVVNSERMGSNLQIFKGLIMSEHVMFELGERLGKQTAHTVVYEASQAVYNEGLAFKEALLRHPQIQGRVQDAEIEMMLRPEGYVGQSEMLVRRAVAQTRAERAARGRK